MNLKKLEVFHAAAKYNSFSKAAVMLLVTPAAVSIQIRDLENHYGVTLFARSGNQVRLTDIGEALYACTSRIFGLTERAESILLEMGKAAKGTLKIGAEETGAKYVLPTFISVFQKEFPEIKVIVKIGTSKELVENLGNRGMTWSSRAQRNRRTEGHP